MLNRNMHEKRDSIQGARMQFPRSNFDMSGAASSAQGYSKVMSNGQPYFVQSVNTGGTRVEVTGEEALNGFLFNESEVSQWTGAWAGSFAQGVECRLELHLPKLEIFSGIRIRPSSNSLDANLAYPSGITISGSEDGTNWAQLLIVPHVDFSAAGWVRNTYREFLFTHNVKAYSRYRYAVTNTGYNNAAYLNRVYGSVIYF